MNKEDQTTLEYIQEMIDLKRYSELLSIPEFNHIDRWSHLKIKIGKYINECLKKKYDKRLVDLVIEDFEFNPRQENVFFRILYEQNDLDNLIKFKENHRVKLSKVWKYIFSSEDSFFIEKILTLHLMDKEKDASEKFSFLDNLLKYKESKELKKVRLILKIFKKALPDINSESYFDLLESLLGRPTGFKHLNKNERYYLIVNLFIVNEIEIPKNSNMSNMLKKRYQTVKRNFKEKEFLKACQ